MKQIEKPRDKQFLESTLEVTARKTNKSSLGGKYFDLFKINNNEMQNVIFLPYVCS